MDGIKILIIEDEMIIGAKISVYLSELGYEVMGILPRAEEAMLQIQQYPPDIILLDINLKGEMDGIQLAGFLQGKCTIPVIFLTANTDDATFQRAKATKPFAFLSKPFNRLDLKRALELTIGLMANSTTTQEESIDGVEDFYALPDRIFICYNKKMVKILFETIFYIQAERNYCRIITQNKEYLLSMPMKQLEKQLPTSIFQRIHRSYVVNLSQVEEIEEGSVIVGSKCLPLSKAMREDFLSRIRRV